MGFHGCALTIHSSRTRFITWLKCVVVPLTQLSDQQVAGRLNSGVRPHKASATVWRHRRCCCSIASPGFWLVALARPWCFVESPFTALASSSLFVELPCSSVAPALRASSSRDNAASSFFLLRVRRGAGTVIVVLRAQAAALHFHGPGLRPNNSFKPKPLRYSKSVAEKACHAFASTTRFGLTQALGSACRLPLRHSDQLLHADGHWPPCPQCYSLAFALGCSMLSGPCSAHGHGYQPCLCSGYSLQSQ